MLQRIQSLYLFIAFLATVALYFFPMAGIYSHIATYKFFVYELRNMVPGEESMFTFVSILPLLLINIFVGILAITCIFMYRRRLMQARWVRIAIFLEIVFIALVFFFYARTIEDNLLASPDYLDEVGIYFPLITLIFLILANRAIIRDEKLVRSADRLR